MLEWIQVTIATTADGIEPLSGRLYQIGITGIEIEDEKDFKDFLENYKQYWDYVDDELMKSKSGETKVKLYVSGNASGQDMLKLVNESVLALKQSDKNHEFGSLEISLINVNEEDWANNWKKYFKPIPVGDKILIKPQWETLEYDTDRIVFEVNPGMTFGTGTHETTRMCICELEKHVKTNCKVLDLGCGSGILSIISLLLGAKSATAADIDPNCKSVAYSNAEMNGIYKDKYTVYSGNILEDESLKIKLGKGYDVVVANIVADVIVSLAADVKQYINNDGIFICSGIIDFRECDVVAAFKENGFEILNTRKEGEWIAIVARVRTAQVCTERVC